MRLRGSRRRVSLSVTDDGRGLDWRTVTTNGYGLRSMRERVERLGGTCLIGPAPRGGTEVLVEVPRS
jgi:signal transduction histidine kinase